MRGTGPARGADPAPPAGPLLGRVVEFFSGWQFAAFALAAILVYELFVVGMLFAPVTDDAFGRFAEDFKTWCFGWDPATGESQPMYLVLMLSEPLVLGIVLAVVFWKPLREVLATPRRLLPHALAGAVLTLGAIPVLVSLAPEEAPGGELPFPAERLRTAHEPPSFALVDHEGREVSLEALQGRVVLLTGVYASCAFTCPMILGQARRAVEALPEAQRGEVTVVAVTLDPRTDTPQILARMAAAQGVSAPGFRLATGDPEVVERLLDRMGIERRRDPATGVIDHSNLFLVVDRRGKMAYRFTLGERQERWLQTALGLLVAEEGTVG
ncbi:MAG TPA: SCO family protein [Vulgatibacter sp.]|nr:SCO family protein [Vulgatibacter sp.]